MKHTHWTLILVLLGTVLCASAVLRTDDPETLVNEADAPSVLEVALPASVGIKLVPPEVNSILRSKLVSHWAAWVPSSNPRELAAVAQQRYQHSLQKLLCTFLI